MTASSLHSLQNQISFKMAAKFNMLSALLLLRKQTLPCSTLLLRKHTAQRPDQLAQSAAKCGCNCIYCVFSVKVMSKMFVCLVFLCGNVHVCYLDGLNKVSFTSVNLQHYSLAQHERCKQGETANVFQQPLNCLSYMFFHISQQSNYPYLLQESTGSFTLRVLKETKKMNTASGYFWLSQFNLPLTVRKYSV